MSSSADVVFQIAEAISAISLPIGGGLAAYSKWRRNAEREKRAREEAARLAADQATREARQEEQSTRELLMDEYKDRIEKLNLKYTDLRTENASLRTEIARLNSYIFTLLGAKQNSPTPPPEMDGNQNG